MHLNHDRLFISFRCLVTTSGEQSQHTPLANSGCEQAWEENTKFSSHLNIYTRLIESEHFYKETKMTEGWTETELTLNFEGVSGNPEMKTLVPLTQHGESWYLRKKIHRNHQAGWAFLFYTSQQINHVEISGLLGGAFKLVCPGCCGQVVIHWI